MPPGYCFFSKNRIFRHEIRQKKLRCKLLFCSLYSCPTVRKLPTNQPVLLHSIPSCMAFMLNFISSHWTYSEYKHYNTIKSQLSTCKTFLYRSRRLGYLSDIDIHKIHWNRWMVNGGYCFFSKTYDDGITNWSGNCFLISRN